MLESVVGVVNTVDEIALEGLMKLIDPFLFFL